MKHNEPILISRNLSKKFLLDDHSEYWALKNISFELFPGDVLGIIGKNGAGKSTLLKILSEVIPPTEGSLEYKGKIVSILEIGTGFHPDLSGKENIFMNASLLGFTKAEVNSIYQEIVDFSGIGKFIHEPVKTYSSGMYLRLALSIALFIKSDILLFDEVISVGDTEFTSKSMNRLLQLKKSGVACIIISHDLSSVIKLCNRCLLLDSGEIVQDSSSQLTVENYLDISFYKDKSITTTSEICQILDVYSSKATYYLDEEVQIVVEYNKSVQTKMDVVIKVRNYFSTVLTCCELYSEDYVEPVQPPGTYKVVCTIPGNIFNAGTFLVDIIIGNKVETLVSVPSAIKYSVKLKEWEKDKKWNEEEEIIPFRPLCKWQTIGQ